MLNGTTRSVSVQMPLIKRILYVDYKETTRVDGREIKRSKEIKSFLAVIRQLIYKFAYNYTDPVNSDESRL